MLARPSDGPRIDPAPWAWSVDPVPSIGFIRAARPRAPVAELVDAPDSKSGFLTEVLVRVRPGAPLFNPSGPAFCRPHVLLTDENARGTESNVRVERAKHSTFHGHVLFAS